MSTQSDQLIYRNATRDELDLAIEWAGAEGWNPGRHDGDIFWETDPKGFVCVEREGEVIGTGSIVSYGGFGFMGFFIVKAGMRGQGIGAPFWHWRKRQLLGRIETGGSIGMDGVFDMEPFYARGDFVFLHRNIRMEGVGGTGNPDVSLELLTDLPWEAVANYDRACFGFSRDGFLDRWVEPRSGVGLGYFRDGRLLGFGVIRRCVNGFKIGPLFADDGEIAESLFMGLSNHAAGEPVFLDTPECNPEALALANRHGMKEVFGCARMVLGPVPNLPWKTRIFGVTTFELG
jgi:hypothetical protein